MSATPHPPKPPTRGPLSERLAATRSIASDDPVLELEGISKQFGAVRLVWG